MRVKWFATIALHQFIPEYDSQLMPAGEGKRPTSKCQQNAVCKNVDKPHRQRDKLNSHICSVSILPFHCLHFTISHVRHSHYLWLWQSQTHMLSQPVEQEPLWSTVWVRWHWSCSIKGWLVWSKTHTYTNVPGYSICTVFSTEITMHALNVCTHLNQWSLLEI